MSDTPVAASTATPAVSSPEAQSEEKKEPTPAAAPAAESASKDEKKEAAPAPEVKKMQAVITTAYGEPDKVLDFGAFPQPSISKPDQVLVKVHSASINPVDSKINRGALAAFIKKTFPFVPGFDVAGEVVAVGTAVKKLAVGDKVYGDVGGQQGSYGEYLLAPQNTLTKIPAGLTYSQAAGVPLVGLTAYQALLIWGKVTEKSRILVLGGASGTGSAAVQIGKAIGAHVFTTASTRNFDFVRGLGADRAVDYTKQKWWETLKGEKLDLIFDTVGDADSWEHGKSLLHKHGTFAQIARKGGSGFGFVASIVGRKIASWFGEPNFKFFLTDVTHGAEQLDAIGKWIESGKFKPVVDSVYEFSKEGAIALFKASEAGKARGKLILEVIKPESPTQSNVDAIAAAAPPLPAEPEPAAAATAPASEASSSSSSDVAPAPATASA